MSYEEEKIKVMLKFDRFSERKKDILELLKKAKKETSGGAIVGIYMSMKEQLDKIELKMVFPERTNL